MKRVDKIRERVAARGVSKEANNEGMATRAKALMPGCVCWLPNGEELICGAGRANHYFLYHPLIWQGRQWVLSLPIAYEVTAEGKVLSGRGERTAWSIDDLRVSMAGQDKYSPPAPT